MRPIDADKLNEKFKARCMQECRWCSYGREDGHCGIVDEEPTICISTTEEEAQNDKKEANITQSPGK